MKILAISGSARKESTNTALLRAMKDIAPSDIELTVLIILIICLSFLQIMKEKNAYCSGRFHQICF